MIGGGASGFFCAIQAASALPGLSVCILEKQDKVLQKVRVSGGGRCNVTHHADKVSELIKQYPRGKNFLKKAFSQFSCMDTVEWFTRHGVPLKTEADGRMFPQSNSSQSIIDCLLREVSRLGIQVRLKAEVQSLEKTDHELIVRLRNGESLRADAVFAGTGGFPKSEHYHWLQELGHSIAPPLPSLFTFNIPDKSLHALMGLSVDQALVKINGSNLEESGPLLITHWGLSGPAVLRLSAWGAEWLAEKKYTFQLSVNWLNEKESSLRERWNSLREAQASLRMGQKNPFGLQARLWDYLLLQAGVEAETRWSELSAKDQNRLIHTLSTQTFEVKGKTTFKEEFVTCGGVNLQEVDPQTMQSRIVPGLYFGGELLHVDGITGGFNFQHAWTSGYIAGRAIAETLKGGAG